MMEKSEIEQTVEMNTITFYEIELIIEETNALISKVKHKIKGKKITQKWISVFLIFFAWVILENFFPKLFKDYLIVLSVFAVLYMLVQFITKPMIRKYSINNYKEIVLVMTKELLKITDKLEAIFNKLEDENNKEETLNKIITKSISNIKEIDKQTYIFRSSEILYSEMSSIISEGSHVAANHGAKTYLSKETEIAYLLL